MLVGLRNGGIKLRVQSGEGRLGKPPLPAETSNMGLGCCGLNKKGKGGGECAMGCWRGHNPSGNFVEGGQGDEGWDRVSERNQWKTQNLDLRIASSQTSCSNRSCTGTVTWDPSGYRRDKKWMCERGAGEWP